MTKPRLPHSDCENCPLSRHHANGPVPWELPEDADLIFLAEAPGESEVEEKRPLIGPSGGTMRQIVDHYRNGERIGYGNLVQCRPPGNADPPLKAIEACAGYRVSQLKEHPNARLVTVGRIAAQHYTDTSSILRDAGTWHGDVLRTIHPAYMLRFPQTFYSFCLQIEKAFKEPVEPHIPEVEYEVVQDLNEIEIHSGVVALDIETTGFDFMGDEITLLSISDRDGFAYLLEPEVLDSVYFAQWYVDLCERNDIEVVWHNGMFDNKFLMHAGLPYRNDYDTIACAYALWETGIGSDKQGYKANINSGFGLKLLLKMLYDVESYGEWDDDGFVGTYEEFLRYAAIDSIYTRRLKIDLWERMDDTQKQLVHRMMNYLEVLTEMSYRGIRYNVDSARQYRRELEATSRSYEMLMRRELDWPEFNPNSHPQAREALYDRLGLPVQYHRKTGNPTTNKDALERLMMEYPDLPFFEYLREYRSINNTISTYIDGFLDYVRPDGRITLNYLIQGTDSGRPSSKSPNILNLPRPSSEKGRRVRGLVLPDEEHVLLKIDYGQMELRVACHEARDEAMADTFREGLDIHTETAKAIIGEEKWISLTKREQKEERTRVGKAVNFGMIYGKTAYTLARDVWDEMTPKEKSRTTFNDVLAETEVWIQEYFKARPKIRNWQQDVIAQARRQGYLETVFGRRRTALPIPSKKNRKAFAHWKNTLMNFPIQSTANEITYEAMVRVHEALEDYDARVMIFVYDELDVSVHPDQLEEVAELVMQIMLDVPREYLGDFVPFEVDADVGKNWGELMPLEKYLEKEEQRAA